MKNSNQTTIVNKSNGTIKILVTLLLACLLVSQSLFAGSLRMIQTEQGTNKESALVNTLNNKESLEFLSYAKELQVLSQIIAKDYFNIHQLIREEQSLTELKQSIKNMDKAFDILNYGIKNEEIQHLITYLVDTKEDYKKILDQPFSMSNGSLVLDYSETIFEGAQSVINYLAKNSNEENLMSDVVFQQQLILQRISKFYIAFQAGFSDQMIVNQLRASIKQFDQGVQKITQHNYSGDLAKEVTVLKKYWPLSRKFYLGMEKGDLTIIVSISTDHMMSSLEKILNSHIPDKSGLQSNELVSLN